MSSIVLDLQNEVTKPDCDIVSVLRKAHLIAVKLGLTGFDKWIVCELNGYQKEDTVPNYRKIRGLLKALDPYRGGISVIIPNKEIEEGISTIPIKNSVSEIISLCENNGIIICNLSGEASVTINNASNSNFQMEYVVCMPCSSVKDIIEKIKNTVLEWTIKLESEGILGEDMKFDITEKETAKRIPQTINNYYGNTNVINAPMEHAAVVAGDDTSVTFTYKKVEEAASDIETSLKVEKISAEDQETAIEMLTEIKDKIAN